MLDALLEFLASAQGFRPYCSDGAVQNTPQAVQHFHHDCLVLFACQQIAIAVDPFWDQEQNRLISVFAAHVQHFPQLEFQVSQRCLTLMFLASQSCLAMMFLELL